MCKHLLLTVSIIWPFRLTAAEYAGVSIALLLTVIGHARGRCGCQDTLMTSYHISPS